MTDSVAPTQIIILGGSGDLSKRKLLPALLDLFTKGFLPKDVQIIGLARTSRTDEEYRAFVKESLQDHEHNHNQENIDAFCSHICYVAGSFDEEQSYLSLQKRISKYEETLGRCTNKLFYLAVPPQYYETIFDKLHAHSMNEPCDALNGWTRVLVEKPFGNDYNTAQELDKKLAALFDEEQIFRIDHYLAKEAVQNILSFRFANTLLRSPWNKDYVKDVRITMYETIDVAHRGNFYDGIGALRDVGQNHLLQLLALIAMGEPASFTTTDIRKKRCEVLESLISYTPETINESVVRAQYAEYTEADGVAEDSQTETYFSFKALLNMEAWQGVPFYISAGKALSEAKVEIEIRFHDVATGPFETKSCETTENCVLLTISPEQTISITLNAKAPGLGYNLESRTLTFACAKGDSEITNSYEKVLLDCIHGDQTLFTETGEVLASWKFITSIIENWDKIPLQTYEKGSSGSEISLV